MYLQNFDINLYTDGHTNTQKHERTDRQADSNISPKIFALRGVFNDKAEEGAEQDQTARECRLILIYTLHRINPWQDMD